MLTVHGVSGVGRGANLRSDAGGLGGSGGSALLVAIQAIAAGVVGVLEVAYLSVEVFDLGVEVGGHGWLGVEVVGSRSAESVMRMRSTGLAATPFYRFTNTLCPDDASSAASPCIR